MDALMAALVAALLTQASDRTPWFAAMLGTRFAGRAAVIAGTVLALAVGNGVAAVAGMLVAGQMSPNARDLLLALALLSAGTTAFWPVKPPPSRDGWRIGAFLTSLFGVLLLAVADRTQFITAALAARSDAPALAAVGATLGASVVNVTAIMIGEAGWRKLPMIPLRIGIGVVLCVVGAIQALSALRLI